MRNAGVVDEDIDRAEFCLELRERAGDLSANLDAAAKGLRLAAFTLDLGDCLRRVLSARGNTRNPSARFSEFERNGFANAAAGAGHDRDFFS